MQQVLRLAAVLALAPLAVLPAAGSAEAPSAAAKPVTLTVYSNLGEKAAVVVKNYGEIAAFQQIEKETGVKIVWQHPPVGQEAEQFNLMMASRSFPDMIYYNWQGIPGGPDKALQDGVILRLNEKIAAQAPNLSRLFAQYPDARKQSMSGDGSLYMFPMIRGIFFKPEDHPLNRYLNPQVRKDWLDKLGLPVPETIEDWERVLLAFKQRDPNGNGKADEIPFVSVRDAGIKYLATSWGVLADFYMDGGRVKFGSIEPAFKRYLAVMRDWYARGLIDKDYLATDNNNFKAKVTGDLAGSYIGSAGGNYLFFTNSMKGRHPTFQLKATPWPRGPAGKAYTGQLDADKIIPGTGLAISATTKYVDQCVAWADHGYSDASVILHNWGVEGESWRWENGKRVLTEKVTKDPTGLDVDSALLRYAIGGVSGWATVQEVSRWRHVIEKITPIFGDYYATAQSSSTALLPPAMTVLPSESATLARIMTEVNTYRDEMFNKFVMGLIPLEEFDTYVARIKQMGIEQALEIQNAALERYKQR